MQQQALLGQQVRGFVDSEIGKYLLSRADERAEGALHQLAGVDPEDAPAIRRLQNEIRVADHFREFLLDAVDRGDDAMALLETNEA